MPLLTARPPVLQASRGGERVSTFRDTRDEGLSPGVWVARQCGMVQPPEGPPLFCGSRGLTSRPLMSGTDQGQETASMGV